MKKKLAVIGTGIAGMASAYRLKDLFDLTVFEKADYIGGHTNTVTIDEGGVPVPIDTGFMVYNEKTYPHLTQLFRELDIQTKPTSMSFSVQHSGSGIEYAGTGLRGLFAQRRRLISLRHWRLLSQMNRFNTTCGEVLEDPRFAAFTLKEYCSDRGYSDDLLLHYLVPMSAAVWSSSPEATLDFPILTFVRFFTNHQFLGLSGQLPWRTVVGGSQTYRDRLVDSFKDRIHLNRGAMRVERTAGGVTVTDSQGHPETFDQIILACHADESLALLAQPTSLEREILPHFKYQLNRATLHTDERVMPRAKDAWASWNYRVDSQVVSMTASTIYWMNSLQGVSKNQNYFVSINDSGLVRRDRILREIDYHHPLYSVESIAAQKRLPELNQNGVIHYCGSYFRYGFHEDALASAVDLANQLRSRLLA